MLKYIQLSIFIFILFSCAKEDRNLEYNVCSEVELINISDRVNNYELQIEDYPLSIRSYINSEFAGYVIESISSYTYLGVFYYIAEMSNGGYILFYADSTFVCADDTFNGGARVNLGMDSMFVGNMDTLIVLTETNLCNDMISFEREILPLLVSGCAYSGCHDTQSHEDGVILEDYQGILEEVEPNDLNDSEIIKTFRANQNSDKFMPPLPALSFTPEQVKLVEDWILQGATNTTCNVPCNSVDASWSEDIYPLLQNHCIGCHQSNNSLGDVNIETYENTLFYVINGELLGSIKHEQGYEAMPEVALKMTDCQIAQIENWVNQGAMEN